MAFRLPTLVLLFVAAPLWAAAQSNRPDEKSAVYYPDALWQHKTPTESGLDPARLKEATDFAVANEVKNPRDLVINHYQTFGTVGHVDAQRLAPFGDDISMVNDQAGRVAAVLDGADGVAERFTEHDLVAVARWIDGGAMDGFVKRLLAAGTTM